MRVRLRTLLVMFGCTLCAGTQWPQAVAAQAASPPPPSAAADAPAPRRRWVMPPPETEAGLAQSDVDPAGDVWLEIAGGVVGVLVAGAVLTGGLVLAMDDDECETGCGVLVGGGLIAVVIAPALGVTIAGDASGGQGKFGIALLCVLPGMLLSLPGMVAGAVIGYRISAPDAPKPNYNATPRAQGGVLLLDLRF